MFSISILYYFIYISFHSVLFLLLSTENVFEKNPERVDSQTKTKNMQNHSKVNHTSKSLCRCLFFDLSTRSWIFRKTLDCVAGMDKMEQDSEKSNCQRVPTLDITLNQKSEHVGVLGIVQSDFTAILVRFGQEL